MIEKLIDPILAPFRWLRTTVFKVKMAPTQVKGEISRAKGQVAAVKGDFQYYKQDIKDAKQFAKDAPGKAGELKARASGGKIVGSADDNDVVMQNSPSISGHHAEFVATPSGFRLNDLGSTNGTFVNDKRVNTHDLIDNDNVRLGKVNFKYKSMV